jgi:predicted aminopeptidase
VTGFDRCRFGNPPPTRSVHIGRNARPTLRPLANWVGIASIALSLVGCSPFYVIRAGIAQARILSARRPLPEVVLDDATHPRTRGKLTLVMEARRFAADSLGLDVGESYTSFTRLDTDTLAMVLSAAHRTRLTSRTWWFPIVGHVPYRGFFDFEEAEKERQALESEGFDTYLRPTAAFSTLGWFADPLMSTLLRYDEVGLVETVIHELSHNHLFVPGRVRFNESYATFVGGVGAIRFFCGRDGGGPDTVWCGRAQARWRDQVRFSRFLDPLVTELEGLYSSGRPEAEVLRARESVFENARQRFTGEVRPTLEVASFQSFVTTPLNNATLLSRMRYYHRLADFAALLEEKEGDLSETIRSLAARARSVDNPFDLLPGEGAAPGDASSGGGGLSALPTR